MEEKEVQLKNNYPTGTAVSCQHPLSSTERNSFPFLLHKNKYLGVQKVSEQQYFVFLLGRPMTGNWKESQELSQVYGMYWNSVLLEPLKIFTTIFKRTSNLKEIHESYWSYSVAHGKILFCNMSNKKELQSTTCGVKCPFASQKIRSNRACNTSESDISTYRERDYLLPVLNNTGIVF